MSFTDGLLNSTSSANDDEFWDTKDVATLFKTTLGAVENWRDLNTGPKYYQLSSKVIRYRKRDVEEWLESKAR